MITPSLLAANAAGTAFGVAAIILSGAVILAALALIVTALVSVVRTETFSPVAKGGWVLLIIVVPLAGSLIWFLIGRRTPPGMSPAAGQA